MTQTVEESFREAVYRLRQNDAGIPVKFRTASLDNDTPEEARYFLDHLADFYVTSARPIDQYPSDPRTIGRGLWIAGGPGRGKTYLACAILNEILHRRDQHRRFLRPYFIASQEYFRLRRRFDGSDSYEDQILRRVESAPVLVFDDLGKEFINERGWSLSEINRVLRGRNANGLPTIVTTNLRREDFAKRYDEALDDFSNEAFTRIPMTRDTRR